MYFVCTCHSTAGSDCCKNITFVHTITIQREQPLRAVQKRGVEKLWECLSAPDIAIMNCSSRHMHCQQSSNWPSEIAIDSVVLDPYHKLILRDEVETFAHRQFLISMASEELKTFLSYVNIKYLKYSDVIIMVTCNLRIACTACLQ